MWDFENCQLITPSHHLIFNKDKKSPQEPSQIIIQILNSEGDIYLAAVPALLGLRTVACEVSFLEINELKIRTYRGTNKPPGSSCTCCHHHRLHRSPSPHLQLLLHLLQHQQWWLQWWYCHPSLRLRHPSHHQTWFFLSWWMNNLNTRYDWSEAG